MTGDHRCPCGTGMAHDDCCGRFHAGDARASTAAELMRSRYAAFVVGARDYLLETWDPSTRPTELRVDPERRWDGLEIVDRAGGTVFDQDGEVEFIAEFTAGGQAQRLHERSRFRRADGRWVYVDAVWAELTDR